MKRCPTCNKTFTDPNLSFCIDDGTPLALIEDAPDEITVVSPSARKGSAADNDVYVPRDWQRDYQPPGSFEQPGQKRRVWPWVVGIVAALLIALVGLGVAVALLMPRMKRTPANNNTNTTQDNRANSNTNSNLTLPSPDANENSSSNANANGGDANEGPAPTDSAQVLTELTDLEHEWTVANINADKQKLNRILADDYVGTSGDGKSQGKAEYLRTIERDTSIEHWEFQDLKVMLLGERATLTGKVRFTVNGREAVFKFVDKFVWREGRWQAVSSEVAAA